MNIYTFTQELETGQMNRNCKEEWGSIKNVLKASPVAQNDESRMT